MKRFCLMLTMLPGLLGANFRGEAADAASVAAAADLQAAEERYRTLSSTIDQLLAAQAELQKRILAQADEIKSLREEVRRLSAASSANPGYASQEELRRLTEQMDRKREADKNLILAELQKLAKISAPVREAPAPVPAPRSSPPPREDRSRNESGYEYVIKPNDTYSKIAHECSKQGLKVTEQQLIKANPKTRPERLIPGRTIFIPAGPAKD